MKNTMKDEILRQLENPRGLELLYRSNKMQFVTEFDSLYPGLRGKPIVEFWRERLQVNEHNLKLGKDFVFLLVAALLAGILIKIPSLFPVSEEYFYTRNVGFIVFPVLATYFALKNELGKIKSLVIFGGILISLVYINVLPRNEADTVILACIHLPIFIWFLMGYSFVGNQPQNLSRRLDYLKFNGDLAVIAALILIAGGLMTGITLGLFEIIDLPIEDFYFQNIVLFTLPGVPVIGTYLIRSNPQLVGKISPMIARIFSPLVLIMLLIYLIAIGLNGIDVYRDREFLLIFNLLLIGVMAIIFFSLSDTSTVARSGKKVWILLLLSVVTLIVNGIALSAIVFRISEWGLTPNRLAVFGANVLILVNLVLVFRKLVSTARGNGAQSEVSLTIARYLPVYAAWVAIVAFFFPMFFGFQ